MAGNHNSGRRPKPTALKIIEGNRGRRPLNENEPRPDPVAPDCPDWLHAYAKELWAWIVPQLEQMGVVGRCDVVDLVALCQSWARWRQAEAEIDAEGITYRPFVVLDDAGNVVEPDDPKARKAVQTIKEHPATKVASRERMACMRAASNLGLTPTMRAKLVGRAPGTPSAESLLDAPAQVR